jgi:hypothetical protein
MSVWYRLLRLRSRLVRSEDMFKVWVFRRQLFTGYECSHPYCNNAATFWQSGDALYTQQVRDYKQNFFILMI